MLSTFLLSSVLAVGQPETAPPPTKLPPPAVTASPAKPLPTEPTVPPAAVILGQAAPDYAGEAQNKYFLEKLLDGTRAGCMLSNRGIQVFGWTSGNYTASSASNSNAPVGFNDYANGGQLNQNWLEVVKPIDTNCKERQFGFRYAAILPGTDARFSIARGLGDPDSDYPIDPMTYGYIEAFLPNLGREGTTIRVGKWASAIGPEVIDATAVPFVTRSYNFMYNPFTHTGVQATTQMNENLSVYYGITTGSDVFIDPAGTATFVGGFKYAPKDGRNTFGVNVVMNDSDYNIAENFANYSSYNAIFTRKVSDRLTYMLDATWSYTENAPGVGYAQWYGFANYLQLKHCNEKVTSNLRFEIFQDDEGFRTGTSGTYYEATYGVTYTARDWLLIRPFIRYDHNVNEPFEGNKNLYTGGIELIARW